MSQLKQLPKYMIDTPTGNVRLTLENMQQLAEMEGRLENINSEINNATKTLRGTKLECDRAVKERAYQEELLAEVVAKVSASKSALAEIEPQVVEKTAQLNDLLETIRTESVAYETKKSELKDRESAIQQKEIQLSNQGNSLGKKSVQLDNEVSDFNQKVAKLKEVTSTL